MSNKTNEVPPRVLRTALSDLYPVEDFPEHLKAPIRSFHRAYRFHLVKALGNLVFYGLALGFLGWIFSQVIDRDVPMITHMKLVNPPAREGGLPAVKAGADLLMGIQVDRHRSCEADITFYVYDGQSKETRVVLPHVDAKGFIGLDKPFIRPLTIPFDAAPGESRIRVVRAYQCPGNFVHEHYPVIDVTPDFAFEILPQQR